MYNFSQETLEILYKNGWYDQRQVDITKYLQYFNDTNQPASSLTQEFLKAFSDIKISFSSELDDNIIFSFIIDPLKGSRCISLNRIKEYTDEWIKKPLCVIGYSDSQDALLMAPTGEVYSVFDNWVTKIGDSGENAIENMCSQQEPQLIPKPVD